MPDDMPHHLPAVPAPVLALWRGLAGDPEVGNPGSRRVVRGSRGLAPPGWTAVLRLGDAWAIDPGEAEDRVVSLLLDLDDPSEPAQVAEVLSPAETLGPGELAYLPGGDDVDADTERRLSQAAADDGVEVAEVSGDALADWLATLPSDDLQESSVEAMDRLLVADVGGRHVAAAGHVLWPSDIAHIGIVVSPAVRGRRVGQALGAAATRRAIGHGLVPQWRAATVNPASRAVAARLGYVEFGRQYSFRL